VDEKHQIIVDAQAFGDGHEARHVDQIIKSVDTTFRKLDSKLDIYEEVILTADSGFHSEAATAAVLGRGIDAYIADTHFRKRDPRFTNQLEDPHWTTALGVSQQSEDQSRLLLPFPTASTVALSAGGVMLGSRRICQ